MADNERKKLREKRTLLFVWVLIAALFLGGATFAWFTFSSSTNVTPMAGAIGEGGVELLISNSPNGEFGETTSLLLDSEGDNLQPVSTADLETFYTSIGQDSSGISTKFKEVTEDIEEMVMSGYVYLRSEGQPCGLYLNPEELNFGDDEQFLASARLGLLISSDTLGSETFIFRLDDLGGADGAEEQVTTESEDVVLSGIDGDGGPDYVDDPALDIETYSASVENGKVVGVKDYMCIVPADEVVSVQYFVYIEGCDANSINAVMDRDMNLQLGFAGGETDE